MKTILALFIGLILFCCTNKRREVSIGFFEISLITGDRVTKLDGSISIDSAAINIIYSGEYVIYKIPLIKYLDNITTTKNDTIEAAFINPDTTLQYFVIKKNDNYGLKYDNDTNDAQRFSLDSLLKEYGIHSSMLRVYSLNLGIPSEKLHLNNRVEVQKYLNIKHDKSDPDSIYRYYDSKLKDIEFSYSNSLDKKEKSKLVKTSFVYLKGGISNEEKISRLESYAEMKQVKVVQHKEYLTLIERYKNDAKLIKMK